MANFLEQSVNSIISQHIKINISNKIFKGINFWDNDRSKDDSKKIITKFPDKKIKYFKSKNLIDFTSLEI